MASSIPQVLSEIAECDDPMIGWEVKHNEVVTSVTAYTVDNYGSVSEAVTAAEQMLEQVLACGDGYTLINRAMIGAWAECERFEAPELDVAGGSWRGHISVVLSPNH